MTVVRAAGDAFMRRSPPGLSLARVEDIDGPIRMRLYRPSLAGALPIMLFIHGGGFIGGGIDTHDAMARTLAKAAGAIVASVHYRLAPEHPWPAAEVDCWAALRFLIDTPPARVDPLRIALAGDSAGAQLALATAIEARNQGIALRYLALLYPLIDPDCATESASRFADGPILSLDGMRWCWECYDPAHMAPKLLDADLGGLPPTTIVLGSADPLHDEGLMLAQALRAAGVAVRCRTYSGMVHGFAGMPHVTPWADEALSVLSNDIAEAVA